MSPAAIRLADGRRLAYEEYGDAAGFPVLNCHGGLLCRLDVEPAAHAAAEIGVRVVSPDRPGVGGSDRRPGGRTVDWVDDARQLIDALGIDRFGVMGWSAGGQYALAVAARLGARVTHTAVIAGCLPLEDRAHRRALSRLDRTLTAWSIRAPVAAHGAFAALGWWARRDPRGLTRWAVAGLPETERRAVLDAGDWLARGVAEAVRDPRGQADDYRSAARPWGFELREVTGPVTLWQGDRDRMVPPAWATELAEGLPSAELVTGPGEDHMIGLTRRPEVLRVLLRSAD